MIRKPNKLPGNIIEKKYELEYGYSILTLQKKRNLNGKNLLIVDDLLATGGTLKCAEELISEVGGNVVLTANTDDDEITLTTCYDTDCTADATLTSSVSVSE